MCAGLRESILCCVSRLLACGLPSSSFVSRWVVFVLFWGGVGLVGGGGVFGGGGLVGGDHEGTVGLRLFLRVLSPRFESFFQEPRLLFFDAGVSGLPLGFPLGS